VVAPAAFVGPIYERLQFTAEATSAVSAALAAFALGLPAYVLMKVLQAAYFAREDTRSPMRMGLVNVGVNVAGSLILFPLIGFVGIAIATSLAGWVNVVLLAAGLRGRLGLGPGRRRQLWRTFLAAAAMAAVVWFAQIGLESWFDGRQWQRVAAMALLVGSGVSAYALLALGLKATSIRELKQGFGR